MKIFTIESLAQIDEVAGLVINEIPANSIVCLYGTMGAGKTTFTKALCKQLGVADNVVSPTFALINEYKSCMGASIFHFDFYRINKIEEVYDFGYEEYFYSKLGTCFIEWPELIEDLLPQEGVIRIYITVQPNGSRLIEIS
jgi:tRNA threonylcarbamoyladenosine biosynthesis protein TsaE